LYDAVESVGPVTAAKVTKSVDKVVPRLCPGALRCDTRPGSPFAAAAGALTNEGGALGPAARRTWVVTPQRGFVALFVIGGGG
jgi:hypothetical protein